MWCRAVASGFARTAAPVAATAAALVASGRSCRCDHSWCSEKKVVRRETPKSLPAILYGDLVHENREIFVMGEINETSAKEIIAQLLYLERQSPGTPITMLINSGGGKVASGLAIHDTMQALRSPVHTVCLGRCSSMAAVLLAAGKSGARHAAPNCRIMVHQPSVAVAGRRRSKEFVIQHGQIEWTRLTTQRLLAEYCGKPLEQIEALLEDDHHMTAEEAMELGLVDHVGVPLAPASDEAGPVTTAPAPSATA